MKKLKYRLLLWLAEKLEVEDLINYDEYNEVVPTKRKPTTAPAGLIQPKDYTHYLKKFPNHE